MQNKAMNEKSSAHDLLAKAMREIRDLFTEGHARQLPEAGTASLATANQQGRPSVRTIYITAVRDEGLVFFVNMDSGKGQQLKNNPQAGLCLFWPQLQTQVTLEGDIEVVSDAQSDVFWRLRPRDAAIASWASDQSAQARGQDELRKSRDQVKHDHDFEPVPRPGQWKAVLLKPDRIEFWNTGWQHLRLRRLYELDADGHWHESLDNP